MSSRDRWLCGAAGLAFVWMTPRRSMFRRLFYALSGGTFVRWAIDGNCLVYDLLGINTHRQGRASPEDFYDRGIHVVHSEVIRRPPEEIYRFWRSFENLPRFMEHLRSVESRDQRTSHWVAKAPGDSSVEWDASIIDDVENELIAWRSLEGADVDSAGSVRFAPIDDGSATEVTVNLDYIPPAGRLGAFVARLFGEEPAQQIADDLRRLRGILEQEPAHTA